VHSLVAATGFAKRACLCRAGAERSWQQTVPTRIVDKIITMFANEVGDFLCSSATWNVAPMLLFPGGTCDVQTPQICAAPNTCDMVMKICLRNR
jgi:hypothetical protein